MKDTQKIRFVGTFDVRLCGSCNERIREMVRKCRYEVSSRAWTFGPSQEQEAPTEARAITSRA